MLKTSRLGISEAIRMSIKNLTCKHQRRNGEFVPMYVNRRNRRNWVKSVRLLGPKWRAVQGRKEIQNNTGQMEIK